MKKNKIKALMALGLSVTCICTSGGLTSFAIEQKASIENKEVFDYKSNNFMEQNLEEAGFLISPDINTTTSEVISVIVELKEEPLAISKLSNKRSSDLTIKTEHENFINSLNTEIVPFNNDEANIAIEVVNEFYNVFNGIVLKVQANKLPEISQMPQVKTIWNNKEVKLPEENIPQTFAAPEDGIVQLGVDKLHEENITGEGIKVGVIDTGIDYNHPQLKDVYKGGYDFVNNDSDPMETTYNDWKGSPYSPEFINGNSYYTSHGTHVSGTIAANPDGINEGAMLAKGVAPNVDLYSYKVLGPYGSGQTDWVLAGIEKAYLDQMDVVNLSLGATVNDPLYPTSIAINNIALAGIIPIVAAGNSGPNESTVGSPGTSPLAITVGASDTNLNIPTFQGNLNDNNINFKLLANNYDYDLNSLKDKSYEIVNCGLGKTTDFEGKDLTGKIALIQRGEITFTEKIANAKKAGAELVFAYNNVDGYINSYLEDGFDYIPSFNLTNVDGKALIDGLETNNSFTFNAISSEFQEGDKLADFSSRGPVGGSFEIKPDIVAPGVNIYSTYPEFINHKEDGEDYSKAYSKISGTSMATPHVAGVVALMLEDAKTKGETMSVEDVKVALMNSAENLNGDYSVYEKGAGRVNAYNSIKDTISIEINNKTKTVENNEIVEIDNITGSLQFGSYYQGTENKERTIKITNTSSEDKEFTLTIANSTPKGNVKDGKANGVALNLPASIKVSANSSIEVNASIVIPETAEKGFYEGTITLTNINDAKEDFLIPYATRYSEKGINSFELSRNSLSSEMDYFHQYFDPNIGFKVSYNSVINNQNLYLKDVITGKRVGLIAQYKNINAIPGKQYVINPAFNGTYLPIIGDYVENRLEIAKEGHYKLELEAFDENDQVFTIEQDLFIDNTPPEIILEDGKEFGLHNISEDDYTVKDGVKAYYIKGRVYDDTVEKLKALGYDITQKSNIVQYYQHLPNERSPYFSGTLNIDDEGNFSIGILPEEIEENPMELSLFSYDNSTAGDYNKEKFFGFIKEGSAYGDITYDKDKIEKNDTQIGHVNFSSMYDVTSIEFIIGFSEKVYDLDSMNINDEFEKYVESLGGTVEFTHEPTKDPYMDEAAAEAHKVIININGLENGLDIVDKTSVLDIAAKAVDDSELFSFIHIFPTKSNKKNIYKTATGEEKQLWIMSYMNLYKFVPKTSRSGINFISAQGFFDEKGFVKRIDYSKVGAKAYVEAPNGEKYDAEISENGTAKAFVPSSFENGIFHVQVPGHFENKVSVRLGKEHEGNLVGVDNAVSILTAYAGDMNGDNIIDDKDKDILTENIGKITTAEENYLASDINKDRVVDDKDLAYITKNFKMVNPRLIEDAEVAIATLLEDKNRENLNIALEKVNLLPESKEKEDFKKLLQEIASEISVNKDNLISLVEKITALNSTNYTEASWDNLQIYLANANKVIADENASNEDVTKAYNELLESFNNLEIKINKDKLQDLINKANTLIEKEYTKESFANFKQALDDAKNILDKKEATQEEVDTVTEKLSKAIESLVKVDQDNKEDENNNNNNNGQGSNNSNNKPSKKPNNKLPNTGSPISSGLVTTFGLITAAVGSMLSKKKKS